MSADCASSLTYKSAQNRLLDSTCERETSRKQTQPFIQPFMLFDYTVLWSIWLIAHSVVKTVQSLKMIKCLFKMFLKEVSMLTKASFGQTYSKNSNIVKYYYNLK